MDRIWIPGRSRPGPSKKYCIPKVTPPEEWSHGSLGQKAKGDVTSDKGIIGETGSRGAMKIPQQKGIHICNPLTSDRQNGPPKIFMP